MVTPLLALAAAAASNPSELPGVWEGTVGNLPVRACFGARIGDSGAYYYLSRLRPIPLDEEEGNDAFSGAERQAVAWASSGHADRLAGR